MESVMFVFTRNGFNDTGTVYAGEIVERFINGIRVRVGDEVKNVMYGDIRIIDEWKEVRTW